MSIDPVTRIWTWDREGLQRRTAGTGLIGTTPTTTALTIGRPGTVTTIAGDLDVTGAVVSDSGIADLAMDQTTPPTTSAGMGFVVGSGDELLVEPAAAPNLTVRIQAANGGTAYSHLGVPRTIVAPVSLAGFVVPAGLAGDQVADAVVVTAAGAIARRAGLVGNPVAPQPVLTVGDVPLALVTLTFGDASIQAGNIADLRVRRAIEGGKIKDDTINAKAMIDDTFDVARFLAKFAADSLTAAVFEKIAAAGALSATADGRAAMAPAYFDATAMHPGSASCKFGAGAFPARNVGTAETNALLITVQPGNGETVTIGTTVYEFRDSTPPVGGTDGRVWVYNGGGGGVGAARTNLRNAIRATTYPGGDATVAYTGGVVPQNFWASVVGNYVRIYSCAVLGALAPGASEAGTVCNDTLATVGDDWVNGSPGPCGGGRAETHTHWAAAAAPGLTAAKIASGTLEFVFPFQPMGCVVINRMRPQNEAYIISGYNVQLTLAGGGAPNNQVNDVIDCIAWGG